MQKEDPFKILDHAKTGQRDLTNLGVLILKVSDPFGDAIDWKRAQREIYKEMIHKLCKILCNKPVWNTYKKKSRPVWNSYSIEIR